MAELRVSIPDAKLGTVLDRVCAMNGYQETVEASDPGNPGANIQVPNPQSKQVFVEEFLKNILRDASINHEVQVAVKTTEESASQKAKAEVGF